MSAQGESHVESMARAFAACDGERVPLDGGSSKVLRFMLERPEGCDAIVSRDVFEIRFGWHPSRHRYFHWLAPAVVSKLLHLAGQPAGPNVRARLGPATIPALQFPAWSFGERLLWLDRSQESISIRVRNVDGELLGAPNVFPDPVAYELTFVNFPTALSCPACAIESLKYRRLSDGALLCAACGRSFVLGDMP